MALCFCPYCALPVLPEAKACPTCFEGLGDDALLEMEAEEWLEARRPCASCLRAVHPLAVRCPFCRSETLP
ncbi:MAG: hypothetical protein FJ090_04865 [Deltaproteobacteria bacterium]|nr:hypothetical protein [Deltaproteobacteria bacterium]